MDFKRVLGDWDVTTGRTFMGAGSPASQRGSVKAGGLASHSLVSRTWMLVVKELGELLAKGFISLSVITSHDGPFEERFLNIAGKATPGANDGAA
jgi:hypothetical protein